MTGVNFRNKLSSLNYCFFHIPYRSFYQHVNFYYLYMTSRIFSAELLPMVSWVGRIFRQFYGSIFSNSGLPGS
jgi:hypothetical protein